MNQHIINKDRRKFNRKAILGFMFSFAKGGKKFIIIATLVSMIISALSLASIFVMQDLIVEINKQIYSQPNLDNIDYYSWILIGVYLGTFLFNYLLSLGISWVTEWSTKHLTDYMFAKLFRTQVMYYDKMKAGEILSRMSNDIEAAIANLPQTLSQIFSSFFSLLAMLIAMFVVSPYFALISLAVIPISFYVTFLIIKKSQKIYSLRQIALGKLNAFLEESISGQQEINLYNQENHFKQEFEKLNQEYVKQQYGADFWFAFIFPWNNFVSALNVAIVSIVGLIFAYNQIPSGGIYASLLELKGMDQINLITYYGNYIVVINTFLLMLRNFQGPLYQTLNTVNVIQSFFSSAARLQELSQAPEEFLVSENLNIKIVDKDEPKKIVRPLLNVLTPANLVIYEQFVQQRKPFLKPIYYKYLPRIDVHATIEIKNLSFSYEPNKPILKNINFKVYQGQTVAIVGPTGSGKSTFINLLTKFYDITDGDILFDGVSIKKITKKSMRHNISIVLQDNVIFNDTVYNNIKYGNRKASRTEIIEAAKIAEAHNFIMQLKDGYETMLKNNGESLSHGEKQLIGIARAILSPSELLILDEATSSVDTTTEKQIQKALLKLVKNKTSFVIAHRLSTIRNADLILVLKDGQIIEQGNHNELLKLNQFYAQLYYSQSYLE